MNEIKEIGENHKQPDKAKKYNRIKIIFSLIELGILLSLLLILVFSGLSLKIRDFALSFNDNPYIQFFIYILIIGVLELIIFTPLSFYTEFMLEHKYSLSNQTFIEWLWESLKSLVVSLILFLPLIFLLYYFLRNLGDFWWVAVGMMVFIFTVVLSEIAPLIIFPLFYKFKPIEDLEIKAKLTEMCEKVGLKIVGVFSFNISKNTKKANAGFTGLGKSKRIILGDNLLNNFTVDEVRSVFAHELGHYHHSHIWKLILSGAISTFVSLFIASVLYKNSLNFFGFKGIDDIAAIPLLFLFLFLYGLITMPLSNAISRRFERTADRYALETMGGKKEFLSSMLKLKDINLADWEPNPIVEFFFYSHPSIKKRMKMAEGIFPDK